MNPESLPEHIRRPHMRPLQPIPMTQDGRQMVALRDPTMLVEKTMAVPQQMMRLLQQFQGEEAVEDIAKAANIDLGQLLHLVQNLDQLGLIWGPTFNELETELRGRLDETGHYPPNSTAGLGETADACREQLDHYFAEVEDPEIEGTVVGIVAPHLDYERGWPNYAAAYECLRRMDAPDRVVILGTNHFGIGDGVVLSEYGFATPLGISAVDQLVVEKLKERHGKALTIDSLDHVGEHSIELQLPWMQHCFGTDVPIVAALVPSPLAEPIEDNDDRVAASTFIKDLNDIVAEVGGTTFFIASSDLSHVGPQFGEPRPVDDQRRFDVERHDREMMAKFIEGDAEAFVEAFKWNQNPTGWCSIGNMAATLNLAQPGTIELIDYRQVSDEAGNVMVSSAAMVLVK